MCGWIYLDISENADICVSMPKSAWMAFALYIPIVILCLLERVLTNFSVYTNLEVLVLRKIMLFLWRHKNWFFFSIVAVILFVFYFRLNIFTSKISNLLLSSGTKRGRNCESWYTLFYLAFTCGFYART